MFERLTERTSDGIAYTKIPLNESHLNKRGIIEQCFTGFVADRLAAYEDIGLSPEEITDMIYRFEAFLCEMTGNRMSKSNYTLDAMILGANDYQQSLCDECWDRSELAKYYELEHEKRLVVLPCKVGDTIYRINIDPLVTENEIECFNIDNIVICDNGDILLKYDAHDGVICTAENIIKGTTYLDYYLVFLTKEEAEKALKGGVE